MKNLKSPSTFLAVAFATGVLALAPPIAIASPTADAKTGKATMVLSDAFVAALDTVNASLQKVIPGQINSGKGELRFPVEGGALDLGTAKAEFIHSGGIIFSVPAVGAGSPPTLTIVDPIVTLPESGSATLQELSVTMVVNGTSSGRIVFATMVLTHTPPIELPSNKKFDRKDIPLTLTQAAADALNAAFSTTAFTVMSLGSLDLNVVTSGKNL